MVCRGDKTTIAGLLLAAGAGSRMGGPKALVHDDRGSWLRRGVTNLVEGGCDPATVVLGAGAAEAVPLLRGTEAKVVVTDDWADGLGASLRAGLEALVLDGVDAALVTLVDLPDLVPEVVARVAAVADGPSSLARACFTDTPGHPVLIGREHWPAVCKEAVGDRGARDYLDRAAPLLVECGDLATGVDVDTFR